LSGIDGIPINFSDSDMTFVVGNSKMFKGVIISNTSGLAVGWLTGHGGSTTLESSLLLGLFGRWLVDDTFSKNLMSLNVVGQYSVIISRSDHSIFSSSESDNIKTPNLSIAVGCHDNIWFVGAALRVRHLTD